MLNKTTSASFLKYGVVTTVDKIDKQVKIESDNFIVSQKSVSKMFCYNKETIIHCNSGIVAICVSYDLEKEPIKHFVMHSTIKLNKGVWLNFISLTPQSNVDIKFYQSTKVEYQKLTNYYQIDRIINKFEVSEIYAYYYNIKGKKYHFDGESHPYYEMTFVDNGKLKTNVDNQEIILNNYEAIIYDKNSYHTQENDSSETCTYMTVMFQFKGKAPKNLFNKKLKISRDEYDMINSFIKYTDSSSKSRNEIILSLFNSIIMMLSENDREFKNKPTSPVNQHYENELLASIIKYINENIYDPITVNTLCDTFSISRSTIQNLFKNNLKSSPKKYINDQKLAKAKLLIKEDSYSISNIAMILGFNSIHYFSRKFTKEFNITPSDFAKQSYRE